MRPATLCLRKIFFGQTVSTHRLARGQAFPDHALRSLGLLAGALVLFAALAPPARAQSTLTRDDIVNQLNHFDAAPDLDVMEQFLLDFGMRRVARVGDALYMRGLGAAHHVHVTELSGKPGTLGFGLCARQLRQRGGRLRDGASRIASFR